MSMELETATMGQLKDYAAMIMAKRDEIRAAEDEVSSTQSKRLEEKHRVDKLEKELWEQIDDEDGLDGELIKKTRSEHRKAVESFSKKDSEWGKAKSNRDTLSKQLLEIIDEKDDPQERIDFDKNVPATKDPKASKKDADEFVEWHLVPVDALDIPKGMLTPLQGIGVTTLGDVQKLINGELEGHEEWEKELKWKKPRQDRMVNSFADKLMELEKAQLAAKEAEGEAETDEVIDDSGYVVAVKILSIGANSAGLKAGDTVSGVKTGETVSIVDGEITLLSGEWELVAQAAT